MSVSINIKNESHKNMLNNKGQKIESCGTPNKISPHELKVTFYYFLLG